MPIPKLAPIMLAFSVQTMQDYRPDSRRILADVIERIMPGYPLMEREQRHTVHVDVTRYVTAQINGMPGFLRLPYGIALCVFNSLPFLRYGRTFRRLPADLQARYLLLWSDAPFRPMRDFIKLIRSSVLFVFFDHPLVLAQLEAERRPHNAAPREVAQG